MEISIIIPVYNDPVGIETTLNALTSQIGVDDIMYEILVVDNNSSDNTPNIIQKYEEKYPELVTFLTETEIQSSYAARNKGIEHSSGDFLAFIDADIWVDNYWVREAHDYLYETTADYVGCRVNLCTPSDSLGIVGKYNQLTGFPIEYYVQDLNYAPTAALLVKSTVINRVGGFDARLISGGDKVFGKIVAEAGFEQDYCERLEVCHPTRNSARSMLNKAVRIGRGKTQIANLYPNYADQGGILTLRNYLPPNPYMMKQRANKRQTNNSIPFSFIYLFGVIYKYTRILGMWYEYLNQKI